MEEISLNYAEQYIQNCKFSNESISNKSQLQNHEIDWKEFLGFFQPSESTSFLKLRNGPQKRTSSIFLVSNLLKFWPDFSSVSDSLNLIDDDWMVGYFFLNS